MIDDQSAKQVGDEIGKQIENTINTEETNKQIKIMKSCNAIAESLTCIEYIGSFWSEAQKKYHCQEAGTLSSGSCELLEYISL